MTDPNFRSVFLRGIDPIALIKQYAEGHCSNLKIPTEKVTFSSNAGGSQLIMPGNDPKSDDIFYISSSFHGSETFATTNCETFKTFALNGKEIRGGTCRWHRAKYSTARFGRVREIFYEKGKVLFQIEGDSCSFECALAECELLKYYPAFSAKYTKIVENIIELHEIIFPGKKLYPAPFYDLFTTCDGPIDPENVPFTTFVPTDDIIAMPIKTIFAARKRNKAEETKTI